jgi:hypothetical protein
MNEVTNDSNGDVYVTFPVHKLTIVPVYDVDGVVKQRRVLASVKVVAEILDASDNPLSIWETPWALQSVRGKTEEDDYLGFIIWEFDKSLCGMVNRGWTRIPCKYAKSDCYKLIIVEVPPFRMTCEKSYKPTLTKDGKLKQTRYWCEPLTDEEEAEDIRYKPPVKVEDNKVCNKGCCIRSTTTNGY